MQNAEIEVFYPTSQAAWRQWLIKNHASHQAVWLVFYKKKAAVQSISWSEAVDVALCFGWIDSKKIKVDEFRSHQFFSKRKPNSTWSKINKTKVAELTQSGLMTEAGFESIKIAQQNGSWSHLDEVEDLLIPADLEQAWQAHPTAKAFYLSLSKTVKKAILQWLVLAKTPATRQKRLAVIVENAELEQKPPHLR